MLEIITCPYELKYSQAIKNKQDGGQVEKILLISTAVLEGKLIFVGKVIFRANYF